MKTNTLLLLGITLMLASACKSKTAALVEGDDTITLAIEYSEQYCGGAELSDTEFEKLTQLRPFSNGTVYISTMVNPETFLDEMKVTLDKGGMSKLNLDSGMYAVSFYSLAPPKEKEDPKDGTEETPSLEAGDNPAQPSGEMSPDIQKQECELRWKRMSAMPFKVVGGKKAYLLPMNKECNPCEPPKP